MITQSTLNGFEATTRGVSYHAYPVADGRWCVRSQRLGLRAARMGGTARYFDTVQDVAKNIKAFDGLDALVAF